jgi:hypothetical protein
VAISVRVAVVGGGLLRSNFDRVGNDLPYPDRPAVDIEVEAGDTLHRTLARAADLLDVRMEDDSDPVDAINWVAFYDEHDEVVLDRSRYILARELMLIDGEGRVTWRNTFEQATFGQILRAADAGVIPGDPRRPYLILQQPGGGDGGFLIWQALLDGWKLLKPMLEAVSAIEGGLQFHDRVARRAGRGVEALEQSYPDVERRRGQPVDLAALITRSAVWHRADLAKSLGCSETFAEALLELFGYSGNDQVLWRADNAADAVFVREYLDEIAYAFGADEADF